MKKIVALCMSLGLLSGCASTMREVGKEFDCNKTAFTIDKSTKRQILDACGMPSETKTVQKYEIMTYSYLRESLKHGRAIGQGLLSGVTGGLSDLAVDHGVKDSDMQREFKEMVVYVDIKSGIVKDFYYHDSDLKGNDESETLMLRANPLFVEGKTEEGIKMLENAISLNPTNHRALNSLAWQLVDLNIDVEKGLGYAKKAVEVFPDSPYNNGTLGVAYYKKGDMNNSEKYLQAAVKLFPAYSPNDYKALQHDMDMLKNVQEAKKNLNP